jgi:pimeloyl-ACP methyl ester carboxylesterase
MESVLITAIDPVLGIPLAARYLASSTHHVIYLTDNGRGSCVEELKGCLSRTLEETFPGPDSAEYAKRIQDRFHVAEADSGSEAAGFPKEISDRFPAREIWFLSGGCFPARRPNRNSAIMRMLSSALSNASLAGATVFNYVYTALGAAGSDHEYAQLQREAREEVLAKCSSANLRCHIFQTSLALGYSASPDMREGNDFTQFLEVLHGLKAEIQNREPEYFDFHPLRCWMPPDLKLNVIPVNILIERMTSIAESGTAASEHFLASSECVPFADLCDQAGEAYDISLLLVQERKELNAVDLLMDQRLEWLRPCLALAQEAARATAPLPGCSAFDSDVNLAVLQNIRKAQDAAYTANSQRIARLHSQFDRRQIQRNGADLVYFTGGSGGTPVVIINAVGQGSQYWHGLIDRLLAHRQVIFWDLRSADLPVPFQVADHAQDLIAILQHEKIDKCHLLAWCTGPKTGLQSYLRLPSAFASMVFLNTTLKCTGISSDLCTPYEQGLEEFCQILESEPELGASMVESLRESGEPGFSGPSGGRDHAVEVLSKINSDLKPCVMAPFRDTDTAIHYAQQILDFYSYDAREDAKQLKAPVLLIASELDSIAAPEMSRLALQLFPAARCVQIQGATHQCLYDRPNLMAGLIEDFLLDPRGPIGTGGEVKEVTAGA